MAKDFKLLDDKEEKTKEDKAREAEGFVKVDMKDGDDEPPQRGVRQQKKDTRWAEHTERARSAERERDEERQRREQTEADNKALREQMAENNRLQREALEMTRRHMEGPPKDDLEDEHKSLKEQRDQLKSEYAKAVAAGNGRLPQDVIDAYDRRYAELEDKLRDNSSARAARQYAPRHDPRQEAARRVEDQIKLKYPDVFSAGERAQAFSQLIYNALVAAGEPVGWNTLDKAMDQTRKHFKIASPGRGAPSDNIRRKFASPPRGGAVGDEESDDRNAELSPEEAAMSRAFSSHLKGADDATIHRRFIRTTRG